jgi:hypothetical protein
VIVRARPAVLATLVFWTGSSAGMMGVEVSVTIVSFDLELHQVADFRSQKDHCAGNLRMNM